MFFSDGFGQNSALPLLPRRSDVSANESSPQWPHDLRALRTHHLSKRRSLSMPVHEMRGHTTVSKEETDVEIELERESLRFYHRDTGTQRNTKRFSLCLCCKCLWAVIAAHRDSPAPLAYYEFFLFLSKYFCYGFSPICSGEIF
jgi:hypothetical protein